MCSLYVWSHFFYEILDKLCDAIIYCFSVYFRCSCIAFCYFVDIFLEKKSCNDLVVVLKVVTFALAFGKDARCQRGCLVTGAL